MRDYLEELLDLARVEDEEQAVEELTGRPAAPVPQARKPGKGQADTSELVEAAGALSPVGNGARRTLEPGRDAEAVRMRARGAETWAGQPGRGTDAAWMRARGSETRAAQPHRGLEKNVPARPVEAAAQARPERAGTLESGNGGEERAGGLRGAVTGTARAAGYRRILSSAAPAVPEGESALRYREPELAAGTGARQVDRVFERDARRYDCGFTLF